MECNLQCSTYGRRQHFDVFAHVMMKGTMLSLSQLDVEQKMERPQAAGPSPSDLMDVDSDGVAPSIPSCRPRASSLPANPPDYTVGYIYSSEMMSHFSPHGHPEQPARIQQIWQTLVRDQLTKKMKWLPIRQVRKEEALLVHSEDHWDKVIALQCEYMLFRGYTLLNHTMCRRQTWVTNKELTLKITMSKCRFMLCQELHEPLF